MNLELFLAKRIHFAKSSNEQKVSTPSIRIAIAGITIGLAAMLLSVSIAIGFKSEVRSKVVGFGAHIQLLNYKSASTYESLPISVEDSILNVIQNIKGVQYIEQFSTQEGIIKTNDNFQGVLFKGVADDYNWDFFKHNLVDGNILNLADSIANQAIVSQYTADKLQLSVGDSFLAYFIQDKVLARKFNIVGIYNTNFENYDKLYVVTNQTILQKLNKWDEDQVSGLEIIIDDFDRLDDVKDEVFFNTLGYRDQDGNTLYVRSIKDIAPNIFNWLDLLDTNVFVIILLMVIVSSVTMISGLLIIILERTNMIGILKALGYSNRKIRKTFLYIASFLILKGMFWGNVFALGVIAIQKIFGIIKIDPNTYYVSEMPVDVNILHIVLINLGCLCLSLLMMIAPSYLVAKISPAKSIRFE